MTYPGFLKSLDFLANKFYSSEFLSYIAPNLVEFGLDEKRQLLYGAIKNGYKKRRMTLFAKPFGRSEIMPARVISKKTLRPIKPISMQIEAWRSRNTSANSIMLLNQNSSIGNIKVANKSMEQPQLQ